MQGNTSLTFSLPIVNDTLVEGDETVLLTLSNPQGGAGLGAQKTRGADDQGRQKGVQFSAPTYTATEGAAAATITVSRTGPMPDTATVRVLDRRRHRPGRHQLQADRGHAHLSAQTSPSDVHRAAAATTSR